MCPAMKGRRAVATTRVVVAAGWSLMPMPVHPGRDDSLHERGKHGYSV